MEKNTYVTRTVTEPDGTKASLIVFDWTNFTQEGVLDAYKNLCDEGRDLADKVAALAEHTFENVVLPFEDLYDRMHRLAGPVHHLKNVDSNAYPGIDKLTASLSVMGASFESDIGQHEGLYQAYKRLRERLGFAALAADEKKIVEDRLRDFRLAGVGLTEDKKAQLKKLHEEGAELAEQFEKNLTEVQKKCVRRIVDERELDGVPEQVKAALKENAKELGQSGWALTLRGDLVRAIMMKATNRALREELFRAHWTEASDTGPFAGENDNGPLVARIRAIAHEEALLLGFDNYAALALETRMAPSVSVVSKFLSDLALRAHPRAHEEWNALSAFAAKELGIPLLEGWDIIFVSEAFRKANFSVDQEVVREYFPEDKVLAGMFSVVASLYGVTVKRVHGVRLWSNEASFYELTDRNGTLLGGLYVDLYSRSGKRSGAWMDHATSRRVLPDGVQLPVAYLNCNFTRPKKAGETAHLTFDEVVTTFHEFGHCLHLLLSKARYAATGMAVVEWDAIELPSQIMEDFAKDLRVMTAMSAHRETGLPIPEGLARQVLAAEEKMPMGMPAGMYLTRQLTFATYDWELYRDYDRTSPSDPYAFYEAVHRRISVTPTYPWMRFANSFSHIFAGGYSAGYHSYLWAETLATDAFEAFRETGNILNENVGNKFLTEILERGAERTMEESYRAFRGRDADPVALLRSYGLA